MKSFSLVGLLFFLSCTKYAGAAEVAQPHRFTAEQFAYMRACTAFGGQLASAVGRFSYCLEHVGLLWDAKRIVVVK